MMQGLSTCPPKFENHSTAEWKFVPFEGGDTLPSSAIEHLIIRQNEYLHTYNTSVCIENIQFINKVVDLTNVNEEPYQTTIRKMCMTEIVIDGLDTR